ncbi:hypothetical protein [Microcoleus sp. S11D4]|uniref:hypothetical protein n=1 Tax=Microcoleus sp. S11D4 TaxID=3055407 RepID=UPI002FD10329
MKSSQESICSAVRQERVCYLLANKDSTALKKYLLNSDIDDPNLFYAEGSRQT